MKRSETEIAIVTLKGSTFATANQILSWKEKAKKHDDLMNKASGKKMMYLIALEERLKKEKHRIEMLPPSIERNFALVILQKIMEKNGN